LFKTATAIVTGLALAASLTACSTSGATPTPTSSVGNLAKCPLRFPLMPRLPAASYVAAGGSARHPLPHTVTAALICNYKTSSGRNLVSEGVVRKPRVLANTLNRNQSLILSVFEPACFPSPGPRHYLVYFTLENRSVAELYFYCDGRAWSSYNQQRYQFSQNVVTLIDNLAASVGVQE